jgi:hypothetical protein
MFTGLRTTDLVQKFRQRVQPVETRQQRRSSPRTVLCSGGRQRSDAGEWFKPSWWTTAKALVGTIVRDVVQLTLCILDQNEIALILQDRSVVSETVLQQEQSAFHQPLQPLSLNDPVLAPHGQPLARTQPTKNFTPVVYIVSSQLYKAPQKSKRSAHA